MARAGGLPLPTITDDRALGSADIQRSLRFNRGDSPYLSRALGSPTSDNKASVSVWLKRTDVSTDNTFFDNYQGTNDRLSMTLVSSTDGDKFSVYQRDSSGIVCNLLTTQVFRDPSAWYHILVAFDTTQGAAADRVKIYVNGTQITAFDTSTYFSQNHNLRAGSGYTTNVGRYGAGSNYFGGYLAEFNYIDGQQLSPTDVGFTDSQTGIWMPRRYEGSYGNNGFRLDFSDNSSTAALGIDKSPNGNDFTPNNFSVSAGEGNDSVLDTPTKNWDTFNPLDPTAKTISDGNLKCLGSAGFMAGSNFAVTSGKWYMEMKYVSGTSNHMISVGFGNPDRSYLRLVRGGDGELTPNTGNVSVTFADPDVLMLALDVDNGKWYIGKNGSYMLSGDPVNGTGFVHSGLSSSEGFVFCAINNTSTGSQTITANFGQQGFTYTPPTGFKAFNSQNLPPNVPSIVRPQRHFETLIYTGNGTTGQSITGLEFKPDLIWIKSRSFANNHHLFDSVRGVNNILRSSSDEVEGTVSGVMSSFNHGGFTVQEASGNNATNDDSSTFVAWCWKAGGSSSTYNIDGTGYGTASAAGLDGGSINPTGASVNTESGFGIYTYTGTGSNATIAHGLGRKPAWIIIKNRNATSGSTENWTVYHQGNTDNPETEYLTLNGTSATADLNTIWNDTEPTSTLISIGSHARVNESASVNYIMYVWSEIPGFSKFGSYTGNGSSDGTYVHLGFRPAFVLFKKSDTNGYYWEIRDNKRDSFNPSEKRIFPNTTDQENSSESMDFLSNGFKLKHSQTGGNASGGTYIYMAFAEQPGEMPFETFPNAR